MGSLASKTGLVSGLDLQGIISAITLYQKQQIDQTTQFQQVKLAQRSAYDLLNTQLLGLNSIADTLGKEASYQKYTTAVGDGDQLTATATSSAKPGSYQFQALRLAAAQQSLSKGFVNSNEQTIGTGTISIASGGDLQTDKALSSLNGGDGVRRGTIRITDRSGATADIDLTAAATIGDVVKSINAATTITVQAEVVGNKLTITDKTGQTSSNLIVANRNNGSAATDLGIATSVAASTLTGSDLFSVSTKFTLSSLNDGNGPRILSGQPSIRIQLTDAPGTQLDVDLSGSLTLGDVVNKINSNASNAGKLTASIASNRLVLTDNTGGGGASPLTVTNLNGNSVVQELGLDKSASGNTLSGKLLAAGPDSVLLRNLRGGQGITTPGQLTLTDRSGRTGTVDLTTAETLDDVLSAINAATDSGSVRLAITAKINAAGNGIELTDTSGSTASNLIIADVAGGTTAADLGISVNSASTVKNSNSLGLRYVGLATSIDTLGPNGGNVRRGTINIVDSSGAGHFIAFDSTTKTVGDVIDKINAGTSGKVTAQLNETGDGFVLVDQAAGAGQIQVTDVGGGSTAADLRLTGTGTTGVDGKSRLSARQTLQITVEATDTLETLTAKITGNKSGLSAAIIDDGSSFSPKRLQLSSSRTGSAGRFLIDDGGLGLGFQVRTAAQNAVLRIGSDPATGFLRTSSGNTFQEAVPGLDISVRKVGAATTSVDVTNDSSTVRSTISKFVDGYNNYVSKFKDLTKFDAGAQQRGALQGDPTVLQSVSAFSSLINGKLYGGSENGLRRLSDFGLTLGDDGKLSIDSSKLQSALDTNPNAVKNFFLDSTNGFAKTLKTTVESFTNGTTGKFTLATESLQNQADGIGSRIDRLNSLLDGRKSQLLNTFSQLESTLSKLKSQQSALSKFSSTNTSN